MLQSLLSYTILWFVWHSLTGEKFIYVELSVNLLWISQKILRVGHFSFQNFAKLGANLVNHIFCLIESLFPLMAMAGLAFHLVRGLVLYAIRSREETIRNHSVAPPPDHRAPEQAGRRTNPQRAGIPTRDQGQAARVEGPS
jgi:hypothetical protein